LKDEKFESLNWNFINDDKTVCLTDEQFEVYNFNPYMLFYEKSN